MTTFQEFWPYYVREHRNAFNRKLHLVGTTTAASVVCFAVLHGPGWLAAIAPVCGYGPAWIGHFFFERNRPATFRYPLWSLRADFRMFVRMILARPLLP